MNAFWLERASLGFPRLCTKITSQEAWSRTGPTLCNQEGEQRHKKPAAPTKHKCKQSMLQPRVTTPRPPACSDERPQPVQLQKHSAHHEADVALNTTRQPDFASSGLCPQKRAHLFHQVIDGRRAAVHVSNISQAAPVPNADFACREQ